MAFDEVNPPLNAVLSAPDADEPRVAYADACEAGGDELRARFIRLQLDALHRKRRGDRTAHAPSLAAHELSDVHGQEWAGPIKDRVSRFAFYRGFVEEIQIDARQFLDTAEELYALAPIRKLFITGLRPVMKEFFASPHLRRIAALYVEYQQIGDEGARLIASSPNLGKLVALGLCGNKITLDGVEAVAASTLLPSLKDVDFSGNPAEVVKEIVGQDDSVPPRVWADPSPEALRIEAKYGRKTWLHTVEDHGYRIPLVFAEC